MKGKKNASTGHIDIDDALLEELFPDNDNHTLHSFNSDDLSAIGRIIAYSAVLGGRVTFYFSNSNNSLGLSITVGQRKRSLLLSGDDADSTFLDGLANGLARIYLKTLESAGGDGTATKGKKRKKEG